MELSLRISSSITRELALTLLSLTPSLFPSLSLALSLPQASPSEAYQFSFLFSFPLPPSPFLLLSFQGFHEVSSSNSHLGFTSVLHSSFQLS